MTTGLVNSWVDVPLVELWHPVQYLGGFGRQPQLRESLEPGSFYLGCGIGFSVLQVEGTDNVLSGSEEICDFTWNLGAGVNYALTDTVDLSFGYRYVGIGKQKIDLCNVAVPDGDVKFDPHVHELRVQIHVEVYSFLNPWR